MRLARQLAGYSQAQAAERLGVDKQTISRWERGERTPSATDYQRAMAEYERARGAPTAGTTALNAAIDQMVSRETVPLRHWPTRVSDGTVRLPTELELARANFLAEVQAMGATREDLDYILRVLDSPETSQLFAGGYRSAKDLAEATLEMESVIEMLTVWAKKRIGRRQHAKRGRGPGESGESGDAE